MSGGGTLCVVPKQELVDNLSGVVRSLDITYLGTTPTGEFKVTEVRKFDRLTLIFSNDYSCFIDISSGGSISSDVVVRWRDGDARPSRHVG